MEGQFIPKEQTFSLFYHSCAKIKIKSPGIVLLSEVFRKTVTTVVVQTDHILTV